MDPQDEADELVFEGYLTKSPPISRANATSFKRWTYRYFVLWGKSKQLFYYTDASCRIEKGRLDLNVCWQIIDHVPSRKYDFVFCIAVPDRRYYLVANSERQRRAWLDELRHVCSKPAVQAGPKPRASTHLGSTLQLPDDSEAEEEDMNELVRSNTAPSSHASFSRELAMWRADNPVYSVLIHDELAWLRLRFPCIELLDLNNQNVLVAWNIGHLRSYGQEDSVFQFEADDTTTICSDIDEMAERLTSGTTQPPAPVQPVQRQPYIMLEFHDRETGAIINDASDAFVVSRPLVTESKQRPEDQVMYSDIDDTKTRALQRALSSSSEQPETDATVAPSGARLTRHDNVRLNTQCAMPLIEETETVTASRAMRAEESSDAHVQDLLDDIDGLLDDSPPPVPEANRSTKTFRIAPYETVHFGSDDA